MAIDWTEIYEKYKGLWVGIKKEDQKKIFQLFDQGRSLGMRRTGGSGVGLAVCKLLMEQHKGSIQIQSFPRRGTTFTIRWPKN